MKASAISIEGSQADQCGDFAPVEEPQFREVGQQRNDGDFADTGHGLDDVRFALPLVVSFEKLGDHVNRFWRGGVIGKFSLK